MPPLSPPMRPPVTCHQPRARPPVATSAARLRPELHAAIRHVRTTWHGGLRRITLAELAQAAHVSRSHFARMFSSCFATGAVSALEEIRLIHSEDLLVGADLSIAEIARTCGFTDPLYFSRRFRTTRGIAPSDFRRGTVRTPPDDRPPGLRLLLRLTSDADPAHCRTRCQERPVEAAPGRAARVR
ncbi:helix-turn-helix transcriptional regulator [Kitasatospora indigofera]|uniref:helix-turn-helix transcriptional regulator n=1 Tax=Kitasatospora indigofera TaxID=67307 RepID=UPI003665B7F5